MSVKFIKPGNMQPKWFNQLIAKAIDNKQKTYRALVDSPTTINMSDLDVVSMHWLAKQSVSKRSAWRASAKKTPESSSLTWTENQGWMAFYFVWYFGVNISSGSQWARRENINTPCATWNKGWCGFLPHPHLQYITEDQESSSGLKTSWRNTYLQERWLQLATTSLLVLSS